jgi:hypothetical protein
MEYIHVRNLEKFHPGYRDRKLQWAKIYFDMVQGDPDCELITDEIDFARLIKIIILELRAQKPLPLDDRFFHMKGFDLKKRSIRKTLDMLHNFVDVCKEPLRNRNVEKEKEEEKEEEKEKDSFFTNFVTAAHNSWNDFSKSNPSLSQINEITPKRRQHLKQRYQQTSFRDFQAILRAISEQPFLTGKNDRNWRVSFDWLIMNDTNYVKVLERKYKNDNNNGIPDSLKKYVKSV